MEEVGEIFDVVAWERDTKSPWWTQRGIVTVIGEHELETAWWQERPARMVATPRDHAVDPGTFCIIDWNADINAIIGRAPAVECAIPALRERLIRALQAQAMPKIIISTAPRSQTAARRALPSFRKVAA